MLNPILSGSPLCAEAGVGAAAKAADKSGSAELLRQLRVASRDNHGFLLNAIFCFIAPWAARFLG